MDILNEVYKSMHDAKPNRRKYMDISEVSEVLYKPLNVILKNMNNDTFSAKLDNTGTSTIILSKAVVENEIYYGNAVIVKKITDVKITKNIDVANILAVVTIGSKSVYIKESKKLGEMFICGDKALSLKQVQDYIISGTMIPFIWINDDQQLVSTVGDNDGVKRLTIQKHIEHDQQFMKHAKFIGVDNTLVYREDLQTVANKIVDGEYFVINRRDINTAKEFLNRAGKKITESEKIIHELQIDFDKMIELV